MVRKVNKVNSYKRKRGNKKFNKVKISDNLKHKRKGKKTLPTVSTEDPLPLQNADYDPTEVDDSSNSSKKTKKKKITSAMAKKIQARLAEEVRQQIIKQRQEHLKETKARTQVEWDVNAARIENYEAEFQLRLSELEKSFKILSDIDNFWTKFHEERRKEEQWQKYLEGSRLPNPASLPEMNTYIYKWTEIEKNDQMSFCITKTQEVMKLLDDLEVLIKYPAPECSLKTLQDLKELRSEMRNLLQDNIDRATFYLFSRIETHMESINVTTSKYSAKCDHFLMSLWAELITPIPSTRGKEVRQPLKVVFEETEVVVIVPVSLLDIHKVMRSMWLNYDHWSDSSQSFSCPPLPNYYRQNLFQLFLAENEIKIDLMQYREKLKTTKKKAISALPLDPTLSQEILAWDSDPQRALSEEIAFREWGEEEELQLKVKALLNKDEVNLRQRTILGALLLLEILHQPPQPKFLRYKHCVTLRTEPPKLEQVEFYVSSNTSDIEDTETGEEADKKIRSNVPSKLENQVDRKKLICIQMKPCQSVLWFEAPQVALWNPKHKYWSVQDIYDVSLDESDGAISFKTGRLGLFGLHVSRYCNMPYEDWVFETDNEDGVKFFLKTPKVELNFRIQEAKVCLESAKLQPLKVVNSILGVYYTPIQLTEVLKKMGLDVFPAPDAAAYIENVESKHYVIEKCIYQIWGLFHRSFRFKKSKFNQFVGKNNIVFQAQEIYVDHQVEYCLIQSSMCSSYVLDINEGSDNYSPEATSEVLRAVDLYGLLSRNCTLKARRLTEVASYVLIETVREFLGLVRPLSFS